MQLWYQNEAILLRVEKNRACFLQNQPDFGNIRGIGWMGYLPRESRFVGEIRFELEETGWFRWCFGDAEVQESL